MTDKINSVQQGREIVRQCMDEIDQAHAYMHAEQWGEAMQAYKKAINILDKQVPPNKGRSGLREEYKLLATKCLVQNMSCQLYLEKSIQDSGMKSVISYGVTEKEIIKAFNFIDSYQIKNQTRLWNGLFVYLTRMEALFRDANMPEPAEAFYRQARYAKMKYYQNLVQKRKPYFRPMNTPTNGFARLFIQMRSSFSQGWASLIENWAPFWTYAGMWLDWHISGFRLGIFWPIMKLVIVPGIIFAMLYTLSMVVVFADKPISPDNIFLRFLYALSFSAYTFTGAGPGDLSLGDNLIGHLIASAEVLWGYTVTVLIISRILNVLSSVTIQAPKSNSLQSNDLASLSDMVDELD
jgi:hypothetical protein